MTLENLSNEAYTLCTELAKHQKPNGETRTSSKRFRHPYKVIKQPTQCSRHHVKLTIVQRLPLAVAIISGYRISMAPFSRVSTGLKVVAKYSICVR